MTYHYIKVIAVRQLVILDSLQIDGFQCKVDVHSKEPEGKTTKFTQRTKNKAIKNIRICVCTHAATKLLLSLITHLLKLFVVPFEI